MVTCCLFTLLLLSARGLYFVHNYCSGLRSADIIKLTVIALN